MMASNSFLWYMLYRQTLRDAFLIHPHTVVQAKSACINKEQAVVSSLSRYIIDMSCIVVILLLSLWYRHSLQCCLSIIGKNDHESILIIALPHDQGTEVSASWERGEEILPGALAAIEEAENGPLLFNLTLIVANSGPVARLDLPYSGKCWNSLLISPGTREFQIS